MSYSTRSRRIPVLLRVNSEVKTNTIPTATINTEKEKSNTKKSISAKKGENENREPVVKYIKESSVKNSRSKALISASKSHSSKQSRPLVSKGTKLTKKSPVLKDRTNVNNKLSKIDVRPVKTKNKPLSEINKVTKSYITKQAIINNDYKLLSEIQVLVERCTTIKKPITEKIDIINNNSETSKMKSSIEKPIKNNSKKEKLIKISKENGSKMNNLPKIEPNINKNSDKKIQEPIFNKITDSQNSNVIKTRVLRRKNISIEEVNKILNEDEEPIPLESDKVLEVKQKFVKVNEIAEDSVSAVNHKINDIIQKPIINKNSEIPDLKTESLSLFKEKVDKDQITCNKFFKSKDNENELKPIVNVKKNPSKQINNHKKNYNDKVIDDNDTTFILKPLKQKQSIKRVSKKLRPRTNKNYCEISRLSQTFNNSETELACTKKSVDENNKRVLPIYKNIELPQDNIKDKEEIYDFPDDSQENVQKNKKRKKTVKRPIVKRVKKVIVPRILVSQEKQKNHIKKDPRTVHFKDQDKMTINEKQTININNVQSYKIPEYLQDAGDSTMQEVSTIKILSNENLEESRKIDLTVTPSIPKTITSELKLFGPKNAITLKPTTQYSNMVNHSLIRKSMSPISKLVDNFDPGSPWRPIDTFSRVQQIVQSTPQINRPPLMRDKKVSVNKINLNKKSISSDDTIHILSTNNNKSLNKEENKISSIVKKNEISPRKFGTILSNLSPVPSKNIPNIYNKSPIKNEQSPVQIESLQTSFSEFPVNEEGITLVSKVNDKENNNNNNNNNTISSPTKFLKQKFSTPSPFRFDKINSSKKIVSGESKQQKLVLQEVNEQSKSDEVSLCIEKSKPIILRQSNLNNFLNLDQMPQQTCISTAHGIFSDIHSTPITVRIPKKHNYEPNIENAFGFDDYDELSNELSPVRNTPTSIINQEQDIQNSMKENASPKIKVKSVELSKNTVKKPILKSVLKKKKPEEKILQFLHKNDENVAEEKNEKIIEKVKNDNELESTNKSILDSISFSDTFDILYEKEEIKVPNNVPLFIDLEPAHFNEPPRRSYQKRKREVNFDISTNSFVNEDLELDEPKPKKKKESKINKEQRKRINEWVKNINETFEEIDHYDLIVE